MWFITRVWIFAYILLNNWVYSGMWLFSIYILKRKPERLNLSICLPNKKTCFHCSLWFSYLSNKFKISYEALLKNYWKLIAGLDAFPIACSQVCFFSNFIHSASLSFQLSVCSVFELDKFLFLILCYHSFFSLHHMPVHIFQKKLYIQESDELFKQLTNNNKIIYSENLTNNNNAAIIVN